MDTSAASLLKDFTFKKNIKIVLNYFLKYMKETNKQTFFLFSLSIITHYLFFLYPLPTLLLLVHLLVEQVLLLVCFLSVTESLKWLFKTSRKKAWKRNIQGTNKGWCQSWRVYTGQKRGWKLSYTKRKH